MNKEMIDSLYNKIGEMRRQWKITNCYSLDAIYHAERVCECDDGLIFTYDDNDIKRIVFCAKSYEIVDQLLVGADIDACIIEFMTKNPSEFVPVGSSKVAAMMRFSNSDCRDVFSESSDVAKYIGTAMVEQASSVDLVEISEMLHDTFKKEVSHFPSEVKLCQFLNDGQFTIHRNEEGHIDALLQAEIMPKKFYINQIINKTNKNVIHAILLDRLKRYVDLGGKYLYAWVDESNVASRRFHGKYGMKHDGMWSMIYSL